MEDRKRNKNQKKMTNWEWFWKIKGPWAETKPTFATLAQPKTTETETKSKIPSDEKKGDNNSHKKTKQKPTRKGKKGTPSLKTIACKKEE